MSERCLFCGAIPDVEKLEKEINQAWFVANSRLKYIVEMQELLKKEGYEYVSTKWIKKGRK